MYEKINFSVKNELQKNSVSLKDCPVVIGETYIPLNLIYSNEYKQNNCLELNLVIKLRKLNVIGNLRVLIAFSSTPFTGFSEALKTVQQNKELMNIDNLDFSLTNVRITIVKLIIAFSKNRAVLGERLLKL